jgi:hypothetical protein
MATVETIGRRREYSGWLGFKRRFIYPFKWFYRRNIWGFGFRLRCVRLFAAAVWHWDTCDYAPTLHMMEIAFREISRLHRENGITSDSRKVARRTLVVSELCRRLHDDDYAELAGHARYDRMSDRQQRAWAKHTNYLAQQDADYLGKVLRNIRNWWQ